MSVPNLPPNAAYPAARTIATHAASDGISAVLQLLFAAAVGITVINLFATQTLIAPIAAALGLDSRLSGMVAMLPQLGYAAGLILLVPLADLLENRQLIVRLLACCALALAVATVSDSGWVFLLAIFLAGSASSAIQIMVPLAALMACEAHRGRVVGNVMSGLMLGILLSRPLASLLVDIGSWRLLYLVLTVLVALVAATLSRTLPTRQPAADLPYLNLIKSLWNLLLSQPVLRRRALTAALAMATFSLFWTAVALLLTQAPFNLNQRHIALFALAGAAGAVAAPLAGRIGDRGWTRPASRAAHALMIAALLLAGVAGAGWGGFTIAAHPLLAIAMLVLAAIGLDAGVTIDQTLGRRAINLLQPEARGRLNGLFVGIFFVGGAVGAASAGLAWINGGWTTVCLLGIAYAAATLVIGALQKD
ncbi:Permeases of the major facilitator superfamily [Collimonas arenae]|uniref:Permeases of the major facilitator superfamily n=1 Tax=Collimonas arenae TaxID=279058 RepID=A0A0A1FIY0_9BURK|nr:MFS transporter [Collimonas arenae]AIY42817.1 Permeases of the major facilitator superfamily [Collimonas arenae]